MLKKCLFPAAGYGTRFLPATKSLPKEMLPVLTKPLIHYGVEEALEAGMSDIAIVTGKGKRAIEDYFDKAYELEDLINGTSKENLLEATNKIIQKATFSFTRQTADARGLGHAIHCAKPLINNEVFGVVLADDLCVNEKGANVMAQMCKIYQKYRCCVIAVMEVEPQNTDKYGIITGDVLDDECIKVTNMVEKPNPKDAPSNTAIIGRYILTPDIFDILAATKPDASGEIQITDALMQLAQKRQVIAYKFRGKRFDCGSIDGHMSANIYMYDRYKKTK